MMLSIASAGPFDVALLSAALLLTAPILLAAIGELISQRAGVFNVGLEGMMLVGAFCSFLVAWRTGSLALGVLAGMAGGCTMGAVMAALAIEARANQIVAGIGVNLVAIGLTTFLYDEIFADRESEVLDRIPSLELIPLSKIPEVGPALFDHDPLVYLAFALVPAAWFLLYRTRWGLSIRAAGELPRAADTAGVSVRRVRWMAVLAAGTLAGLGGVVLSLAQVGLFRQEMTAGRGFLALVAVIFGRWKPFGVLGACLVLGVADALQLRLQGSETVPASVWVVAAVAALAWTLYVLVARDARSRRVALAFGIAVGVAGTGLVLTAPAFALPSQMWQALPYLLGLVVLAGVVGQSSLPSALTIPYRRGET